MGEVIRCITTTNAAGWEGFGRRMAQSFRDRWPADVSLTVYAEGFEPDVDGLEVAALPEWVDEFKARHRDNPIRNGKTARGYDFRVDACKFVHKVAALTDFAAELKDGIVIWLDADIYTHSPVTHKWLSGLFPGGRYIAWLDRANTYPECGFVMFRPEYPHHWKLMRQWRAMYESDEVFAFPETHDCFTLQYLIDRAVANGRFPSPASLSGDARRYGHPAAVGPLSACIDHMKGDRKYQGRTPKIEHRLHDHHPYWS